MEIVIIELPKHIGKRRKKDKEFKFYKVMSFIAKNGGREMDLTIDVENYKLNIRAAGVIIHNNKILTHKNINKDHYALPGGRVEIGENSELTVKRELKEELGKEIDIKGYIATIENFFELEGKKYHEIFFIHRAEFADKNDQAINTTMHNVEGKEYLNYEWLDLDNIDKYNIVPNCLKEILKGNQFPVHKIYEDKI